MLVCILILCILRFNGVQSVNLFLEEFYLEFVNEEYFDVEKTTFEIVMQNETFNTFSADIFVTKCFPENAMVSINTWLKSNGEYDVPTGLGGTMKMCDLKDETLLFKSVFEGLGFREEECPPPPGRYGNPSFYPDLRMMPDSFPGSQYMLDLAIESDDKMLVHGRTYVTLF